VRCLRLICHCVCLGGIHDAGLQTRPGRASAASSECGAASLVAGGAVWTDRSALPPLGWRLSLRVRCSDLKCPKVRNCLFFSRPGSQDPDLCPFRGFYYGEGAALWDDAIGCHAEVWHGTAHRPTLAEERSEIGHARSSTGCDWLPTHSWAYEKPLSRKCRSGQGRNRLQFGPSPRWGAPPS